MKRGPAPKSREAAEIAGNPGKRRLRGPPPNLGAAPALAPPPAHLSKMAKQFWKQNYEPLRRAGVLQATDLLAFELLAAAYARWRDAEAQLEADGARVKTANGSSGASPFFRITRQCADEVRALCDLFGLTPPSRARLEVDPPRRAPVDEDDPAAEFLDFGEFSGLIGRAKGN